MDTLIIDTREEPEFAGGHVAGAINIPPGQFTGGKLPSLLAVRPRDSEIIVYCRSGSRSYVVAHILQEHGFSHITNGINQGHVEKLLASR